MSGNRWLARLKNERAHETAPTEPTKPVEKDAAAGFVGFVGLESQAQAKTPPAEGGGFVGFVGADAAAVPKSAESAANDNSAPEFRDKYARTREHLPEADADAFAQRVERFAERGMDLETAEALADRLRFRDQEGDDRRLCLECSHLGTHGRCIAAATGRLPGASARLEPVQTILQRCEAFGLRKGLV